MDKAKIAGKPSFQSNMRGDSIDSLVTQADFLYTKYYAILESANEQIDKNSDADPDKITALIGWVEKFGFIKKELKNRSYKHLSSIEIIHDYMIEEKKEIEKKSGKKYTNLIIYCIEEKLSELQDNMRYLLKLDQMSVEIDNDLIPRDGIQHLLREVSDDEIPDEIKEKIVEIDQEIRRRFEEFDMSDSDIDFLTYLYYPPEYWWRDLRKPDVGIKKMERNYDWYDSNWRG